MWRITHICLRKLSSSQSLKTRRLLSSRQMSSDVDKHDDSYVLPKDIQVVICGGGVMGAAVAYHLAALGWGSRTVIIESGKLVDPLFIYLFTYFFINYQNCLFYFYFYFKLYCFFPEWEKDQHGMHQAWLERSSQVLHR